MEAELARRWMMVWEVSEAQENQTRDGCGFYRTVLDNFFVPVATQQSQMELHQAAGNGNLHLVKQLLKQGAALESRDENGWTPLHAAALTGYTAVVKFLIQRGAVIHSGNHSGYTPLHHAAWSGHTSVAELLVARGALVVAASHGGLTPLHCAAANGHTLMTQLLLRHAAEPLALDRNHWTALHWATATNRLHIMDLLISWPVSPDVRSQGVIAPLHIAAELGRADALRLLVANGADVNIRDELGRTPLSVASTNGHEEIVELLLQMQADINLVDHNGCTALHKASTAGHLSIVHLLVSGSAAQVDGKDGLNLTPLHRASIFGHVEVASYLLDHGADINAHEVAMVFLTSCCWIRARLTDRFWRKQEVLQYARHFRGRKNRCYSLAVRAVRRSFVFSTNARCQKKRDMRKLWVTRIEAGALEHGVKYHNFISGLYKCQVELNRKVLADLAIFEPKTFKSLAALAKRRGEEGLVAAGGEQPAGIFSRLWKVV